MSRLFGVVLVLALAALAAPARANTQFAVSPLSSDHLVAVGEAARGVLTVTNTGDAWAGFTVSLHDFTTQEDGVDLWAQVGSHPRSLGQWITFSPPYLSLPPGGQGVISYEIHIPVPGEGEPLPEGSHWAAIKVEGDRVRVGAEQGSGEPAGSDFGIKVRFVFGIKIYAEVAGTAQPGLEAVSLEALAGAAGLVAVFANTGNVILRPTVWLELRDAEGEVLAVLDALRVTAQPGTRRRYVFALADLREPLPDGDYHAVAIADWGGPRLVGLQGRLRLEDVDGDGEPATDAG